LRIWGFEDLGIWGFGDLGIWGFSCDLVPGIWDFMSVGEASAETISSRIPWFYADM
jgi:hypothetical protein